MLTSGIVIIVQEKQQESNLFKIQLLPSPGGNRLLPSSRTFPAVQRPLWLVAHPSFNLFILVFIPPRFAPSHPPLHPRIHSFSQVFLLLTGTHPLRWTLRCGVWIVFLLALLGNGCVVFVLSCSRNRIDVPRWLLNLIPELPWHILIHCCKFTLLWWLESNGNFQVSRLQPRYGRLLHGPLFGWVHPLFLFGPLLGLYLGDLSLYLISIWVSFGPLFGWDRDLQLLTFYTRHMIGCPTIWLKN